MKEKELRKILAEKQKEIEKVQREYESLRFVNQINAIIDEIKKSTAVISVIKDNNLNASDARLLGASVANRIGEIYKDSADEIDKNQLRRSRKNEARKERRARKADRESVSNTANQSASVNRSTMVKTLPDHTGMGGAGDEQMRQY
ncbi:MAG: hypothetical protein IJ058_06560 [Lachnospiraceae bacterium]|nr:hypothetical protein [Lachnospiraceae bacterium]